MSRHNLRWLARLVPPNNPINARELSLGPRLSLFSEVSYSLQSVPSLHFTLPHIGTIRVDVVSVTRVGSLISWLRAYWYRSRISVRH